ncbi:Camp And Camp-Inhibited Cgmp 3',5'-Cyclic Phosphodiesterase 10A [Manis pentadactyla]|nr:Camp And Camp-Inhibited Cgmp 3',5'-Cyclic Phosphodiesterase 10A [Manis pentadactyla]
MSRPRPKQRREAREQDRHGGAAGWNSLTQTHGPVAPSSSELDSPETEIVKNKRDEIGQVPGVVQEEDTLPNCSAPVKMTGMGQNVMIKIPKVTSNHWAMNPHMALTDNRPPLSKLLNASWDGEREARGSATEGDLRMALSKMGHTVRDQETRRVHSPPP